MQPVLRQLEMSTPKFQHLKRVEAGQEMREGERGIYIMCCVYNIYIYINNVFYWYKHV